MSDQTKPTKKADYRKDLANFLKHVIGKTFTEEMYSQVSEILKQALSRKRATTASLSVTVNGQSYVVAHRCAWYGKDTGTEDNPKVDPKCWAIINGIEKIAELGLKQPVNGVDWRKNTGKNSGWNQYCEFGQTEYTRSNAKRKELESKSAKATAAWMADGMKEGATKEAAMAASKEFTAFVGAPEPKTKPANFNTKEAIIEQLAKLGLTVNAQ